jgi:hypothetical protein
VTRLACWLYAAAIACWFAATCVWGVPLWSRWAVLAAALPAVVACWVTTRRFARPSGVVVPLVLLVGYGLLLGIASKAAGLALAKATMFGATTLTCLLGGVLLVERYGRDRLFAVWRLAWRVLLAYSVVALALGLWPRSGVGLYGPTGNPNMFGVLLVSLGTVLFLPQPPGARRSGVFALEAAVGLALLLMTRCRSAMLGVALATTAVILLGHGPRRWMWSAVVVVCAVTVLLAMPRASVDHVRSVVHKTSGVGQSDVEGGALGTRLPTWKVSWGAMLSGLPLGHGWGVKEHAPREWSLDFQSLGYGREEGTSWLPIGEELGFPGLLFVAWIWFLLARRALSLPSRNRPLAYAVLATMFGIASFEGWFLSPGSWESMFFWSAVGILFARPAPERVPVFVPMPLAPAVSSR